MKILLTALILTTLCLPPAEANSDLPDLTGSGGTAPGGIHPGLEFSASFTMTNFGGELPPPQPTLLKLRVELASSPTDPNPIVVDDGFTDTSEIRPAGTNTTQILSSLVIPADTPPGTYILRVIINSDSAIAECNENNNTVILNSAFDVLPIVDLEFRFPNPIEISGDDIVRGAGETFEVTARVKNTGSLQDIPPFPIDFYLVPDSVEGNGFFPSAASFDPSPFTFLGRIMSPPFPATNQIAFGPSNGELPVTASFSLPADLDFLNYKIGAIINPDLLFPEIFSGEFNTKKSGDLITVRYVRDRPDYTPGLSTTITVTPSNVAAGEFATFTGQVINLNNFTTTSITTIRHYLSNSTPNAESLIGTTLMPPVEAGTPYNFSKSLRIPAWISPRDAQYRFEIDSAGVVPESNEKNNTAIFGPEFTITPPTLPDLVAEAASGMFTPSTAKPGEPLTTQVTIPNRGFSGSGSFSVQFFLSANTVLGDGDDITIDTRSVPNIGPGNSATLTPTITLPAASGLLPGTYRFGWKIDSTNSVAELSDSNNDTFSNQILTVTPPAPTLLPDLIPSILRAPATSTVFGDPLIMEVVMENIGKATATGSELSLALSSDTKIGNADDIPLVIESVSDIAAGATEDIKITAASPAGASLPTGAYFIIATADVGEKIDESNETNNPVIFLSTPVSLRQRDNRDLPALALESAGASPRTLPPGAILSPFVTVANGSNNPATGVTTTLVLSADSTAGNSDDIPLATYGPSPFASQESITYNADIPLPPTVDPGNYTLIWTLDPAGLIPNTKNETLTQQLTIRAPRLQLLIADPHPTTPELALLDSDPAFVYQLETSTTLTPGSWQNAGSAVTGNPNTAILFTPTVPSSLRRFFRATASSP